MLEVSHHSMSIFRSCPMKWKWHYVDRLTPKRTAPQLTLGQVIHEAFDMHYKAHQTSTILKYITKTYEGHIKNALPDDVERLIIDHKTALGMWLNYPEKRLNFDEIRSEEKFKERINDLRGVHLVGRIDGLVRHNKSWWIREVKVTGSHMRAFEGRAQTSPQATGYVYALKAKTGYDIEGILFDVIKRPRLTKHVAESADEFAERIYLDYGDTKKLNMYFKRYYTYRSPVDLKHYEQDISKVVKHMRKAIRHSIFYRNQDSCWAYNSECPYRKVCYVEQPDKLTLELYYDKR